MATRNVLYGKVNRPKNFSIINSSALHRLFPSSFVSLSRNLFTTLILHDIAIRIGRLPFSLSTLFLLILSSRLLSTQVYSRFPRFICNWVTDLATVREREKEREREREKKIIIDKSIKKNMQIRNDINDLVSEVHIVIFHQFYLTNVLLTFPVHCYVRDKNVFVVNHLVIYNRTILHVKTDNVNIVY